MIAYEVEVQNSRTEGFWHPHKEWTLEPVGRFDTLSTAICRAMPLIDGNECVFVSVVTLDAATPGHTTTEVLYDFTRGNFRVQGREK